MINFEENLEKYNQKELEKEKERFDKFLQYRIISNHIKSGDLDAVKKFFEENKINFGRDHLWLAIENEDLPMIEFLKKNNVTPSCEDLYRIINSKKLLLASFLIESNTIDLNRKINVGLRSETCLSKAIEMKSPAMVSCLLKNGADPNFEIKKDYITVHPLEIAAEMKEIVMFRMLLDYGGDLSKYSIDLIQFISDDSFGQFLGRKLLEIKELKK